MFLLKKALFKGAALAGLAFWAGLLFISCPGPNDPVNAEPFVHISSGADLAKIGVEPSHPLSGNYLLENDISITGWLPIGDEAAPFTGIFDGNGKTISLSSFSAAAISGKSYLGLFGYVKGASAKAEIKNLTLQSSVNAASTKEQSAIGLVVGHAEMAEIENITLSGTFTFTSSRTILLGGLAGQAGKGALIKNSRSSLTMDISPGGGAGLAAYNYAGGFVGMFRDGAGMDNCHNRGAVRVDNVKNNVAGQVFVGGITGGSWLSFNSAYHGYIQDSSSTGSITGRASGSWTYAGGIAGIIVGGSDASLQNTTRIVRCFASGTVSVAGTGSAFPHAGGIVGYLYYGALVSQSYFNGIVIADKATDYTGGIAGYSSQAAGSHSRIEDCWSGGRVQGFNNAGGIVGQSQINTYVRRCYSRAVIVAANSAGDFGAGGIAGSNISTLKDALSANVALNPSVSAPGGENIGRITGNDYGDIRSNNHAWQGMSVRVAGSEININPKGRDTQHGADLAEQMPPQAFYVGLGWDFNKVWTMGDEGYPVLVWQVK